MSERKIRLPTFTKEEKKELKELLEDAIQDYYESGDEEGVEIWKEITQHVKKGFLTKEEIETVMEEIYMLVDQVYCGDIDNMDEAYILWSIRRKLSKLI